jgi:DNA-binding transcriptional MerR regulator
MRINQAAIALGVSPDTLKRLERQNLLVPVRDWRGHRRYSDGDLVRARHLLFPGASQAAGR